MILQNYYFMYCFGLSLLITLIFLSGGSAYAPTEIFTAHQEVYTPIVWLTDIHLDLLFDPHASGKNWCRVKLNVEEAQQRKETTSTSVPFGRQRRMSSEMSVKEQEKEAVLTLPAWWGRYGCDAPPQLVTHCFNSLVNLTASHLLHVAMFESSDFLPITTQSRRLGSPFVVITGDSSAHYWESRAKEHRWQSLVTLTSMLQNLSDSLGDAYNELVSLQTLQQQQPFVPLFGWDSYKPSGFLRHEKKDETKNNEENDAGHQGVGSQVVIIVGNNDLPENYGMEEWDSWAGRLFKLWSPHFIPPTAENTESFHRGMYYWTPIYSTPGLRAICLNTMWWSMGFPWTTKRRRPSDPGGQLAWLKEQLKDAEQKNESVFILGHIPPGISYSADQAFSIQPQWYKDYEEAFLKLIAKYRRCVVAQLFGHFHTDDFRVETLQRELQDGRVAERQKRQKAIEDGHQIPQKESTTTTTVGAMLLAPSVGTTHGNNPGFRILDLITSTGVAGVVLLEEQSPTDELYIVVATGSQRTGVTVTEASTSAVDQRFVLLDYHQYVSHLHSPIVTELGTYSPVIPPPFVKEYSFREVYRQPDVTASSIENALTKIHTDKHFFKQFWTHFDTGGSQPAAFFLRCYQTVSLTLKECLNGLMNEAGSREY